MNYLAFGIWFRCMVALVIVFVSDSVFCADNLHIKGGSADAFFVYGNWQEDSNYPYDGDASFAPNGTKGCTLGNLYIFVSQGAERDQGTASSTTAVIVQWYEADFCIGGVSTVWGTTVVDVLQNVFINDADFTVDKKLNTARLQTQIQVSSWFSSQPINLNLDLTWTGYGNTGQEVDRETLRTLSGNVFKLQLNRQYRDARVIGNVTGGSNLRIPCNDVQCQQRPIPGVIQYIKGGTFSK